MTQPVLRIPEPPPSAALTYQDFSRMSQAQLQRIVSTATAALADRTRQFDLFAPPDPEPEPEELGRVWSPSQLNKMLNCQASWWARYGLALPETRSSSLALGSAVHQAVNVFYQCKIEKRDAPGAEDLVQLAHTALDEQLAGLHGPVELEADESADDLAAAAAATVLAYQPIMEQIEPAASEVEVRGEIGGVRVRGYIDLLDTEGRIIDLKTSKKTPSNIPPGYGVQLATYEALHPQASGKGRLDYVVRLKRETKIVTLNHEASEADRRSVEALYPLAQEVAQGGLFLPNRGSHLCSKRMCSYWQWCEREYGGTVNA